MHGFRQQEVLLVSGQRQAVDLAPFDLVLHEADVRKGVTGVVICVEQARRGGMGTGDKTEIVISSVVINIVDWDKDGDGMGESMEQVE